MAHVNRANFQKYISWVFCIFQLYCLSPLLKTKYARTDTKVNFFQTYIILQFSLSLLMVYITTMEFKVLNMPQDLTNQSVVIIIIIANSITILESIVKFQNQTKIMEILLKIDELMVDTFDVCINYNDIHRRIFWKIVILSGVLFITNLVGMALFHNKISSITLFIAVVAVVYHKMSIMTRMLQNDFYVEMIYERLVTLNVALLSLHGKNTETEFSEKIIKLQECYGQLWQLSKCLYTTFRWSTMAILFESIVDIINLANILYVNMVTDENISIKLSKL